MDVPRGTNARATIGGRQYRGHTLDEMMREGLTPSVVDDAIRFGQGSTGASGRVAYYSPTNNVTVIVENGRVVTVSSGQLKPADDRDFRHNSEPSLRGCERQPSRTRTGRLPLDRLVWELKTRITALQGVADQEWVEEVRSAWWQLESVNARWIESGRNELSKNELREVDDALDSSCRCSSRTDRAPSGSSHRQANSPPRRLIRRHSQRLKVRRADDRRSAPRWPYRQGSRGAVTTSRMVDELLMRGADDWVMAVDVAWLASSVGGADTDHEVLTLSVQTIRAVVGEGLMQIGDVTEGGFFGWDLKPEAAVEKVARDWIALGRPPDLGDVCWLANTPAGDPRAKAIAERREL